MKEKTGVLACNIFATEKCQWVLHSKMESYAFCAKKKCEDVGKNFCSEKFILLF